ncbi:MAG: LuxR C-terminal-related transcriptional regulator [Pseudomonas sp.]|uniref:helix-turn-helix transcriptional regulator n=1 Tax=Pseudomonas sp. TaxID=306 RepID=UPI00239ECE1B|nr:LuxR C-terminal-related transcriptional regulator [Pseudomonas sp.]MDE1195423.1 LuxR C-terminal-related transcriptional regulator [Pseudomonas sp.]
MEKTTAPARRTGKPGDATDPQRPKTPPPGGGGGEKKGGARPRPPRPTKKNRGAPPRRGGTPRGGGAPCRRDLLPYCWSAECRRARGRSRHFWEQRQQFGLRNGLSIPLRYELFRGTLSVAFDDSQAGEKTDFSSPAISKLFMLVPYLLAGMRHQFQNSIPARQGLTSKEMECLYWASAGKTSWEISQILTCSERTIDFHLLNVRRKFGSVRRGGGGGGVF